MTVVKALREDALSSDQRDSESMSHAPLEPESIADAVLLAIDQPWGVSASEMTARASANGFVL